MITDAQGLNFKKGDRLTADQIESLRRALIKATPSPLGHVGLIIKETPDGWNAIVKQQPTRRTAADIYAFQVVVTDTDKVKIRFGTVNEQTPTINGTPLNQDLGIAPELDIDVFADGQRIVYLQVNLDGNFNFDSIQILQAPALPTDTDTQGHIQLNTVFVEDEQISGIGTPQVRNSLFYLYRGPGALENQHLFFSR